MTARCRQFLELQIRRHSCVE